MYDRSGTRDLAGGGGGGGRGGGAPRIGVSGHRGGGVCGLPGGCRAESARSL
eukprot:COSAG01_NODE_12082_length_1803_cov_42.661972_3_plen_51_part_01